MGVNPCCGNDLQKGTRIVAIVEIVYYILALLMIFGILLFIFVLGAAAISSASKKEGNEEEDKSFAFAIAGVAVFSIIAVIACFTTIISLIFAVVLLKGSKERAHGKCKAWLIFRGIMWFLSWISLILGFIPSLWDIFVSPYFMWVTYSYMQELKNEGPENRGVVYSRPPQPSKV